MKTVKQIDILRDCFFFLLSSRTTRRSTCFLKNLFICSTNRRIMLLGLKSASY